MFVDSDDWVTPDFVECLYHAASKNKADIATADYYTSKNGEVIEYCHLGKNLNIDTSKIKELVLKNGCRAVTSIFRRELFFDNNLFFPENLIYEDNAIVVALFLSAKKIVKIDNIVYYYRLDNTSTTRQRNNYRFFDRLETSKMMLENARRCDPDQKYKELIERLFVRLYYVNTFYVAVNEFDKYPKKILRKAAIEMRGLVNKRVIDKEIGLKLSILIRAAMFHPALYRLILYASKQGKQIFRLLKNR